MQLISLRAYSLQMDSQQNMYKYGFLILPSIPFVINIFLDLRFAATFQKIWFLYFIIKRIYPSIIAPIGSWMVFYLTCDPFASKGVCANSCIGFFCLCLRTPMGPTLSLLGPLISLQLFLLNVCNCSSWNLPL